MTSIKLFLIKFLFNSSTDCYDKYMETVSDEIYFLLK